MAERDRVSTAVAPAPTFGSTLGADYTQERSSDEIRQHIAATRESITETVDELSSRVQQTFDWKTYVADYPLAATGIAAGVGLLVGFMVIKSRPSPGERIHDALADLIEDAAERIQTQFDDFGVRRPGLGRTLKATAIATLMQAGGEFARQKFLGNDHGQERETEADTYLGEMDEVDANYHTDPRHPFRY
jgi:ElaB/YqjD/DUF883 family membrane-anchored ribosome-binding protein